MAKTKSKSSGGKRGGNKGGPSRGGSGGARPITDHDQIRQWAESRGAQPTCVRGTGGGGDTGMIRLDSPGFSGAESLQPIDWDEWFRTFEEQNLTLLVQETTKGGQQSNFNKLVGRDTISGGGGSRGKSGGRAGATRAGSSRGGSRAGGAKKSAGALRGGGGRAGGGAKRAASKSSRGSAGPKRAGGKSGGSSRSAASAKSRSGTAKSRAGSTGAGRRGR